MFTLLLGHPVLVMNRFFQANDVWNPDSKVCRFVDDMPRIMNYEYYKLHG